MMYSNVLESLSYSNLNADAKKAVYDLFSETCRMQGPVALDAVQLFNQRKFLPTSLRFYSALLNKTNKESFRFLSPSQRIALEQDLLFAFYIISSEYHLVRQFQLEAEDSTRASLRELEIKIKKCAYLIHSIRKEDPSLEAKHLCMMEESEKYLKFLGFDIASHLVEGIDSLMSADKDNLLKWMEEAKTVVLKTGITEVKNKRLNWILSSRLALSVLQVLPAQFANAGRAEQEIATPDQVTGYLGWIASYTLLGINLFLLVKHTISGPWMSEAERTLPLSTWERFTTQVEQRKFTILNDLLGATVCMASFFWLKGTGEAGYIGSFLFIGYLMVDVCLSAWQFVEASTDHNIELQRYQLDIEALNNQLTQLPLDTEAKDRLSIQLSHLIEAQTQCKLEWQYKKYRRISEITYKLGAMLAYTVIYCFFLPPMEIVASTRLILNSVGTIVYFLLTIAYRSVDGQLDIDKATSYQQSATVECDKMLQQFKALKALDAPDSNQFIKPQLYLDMKRLLVDARYQSDLISYQKLKITHDLCLAIFAPTLLFFSVTFMPMGLGLGALSLGYALAQLSTQMIKKPKAIVLPKFDEAAYQKFLNLPNPTIEDLNPESSVVKKSGTAFFIDKKSAIKTSEHDGHELLPLTVKRNPIV